MNVLNKSKLNRTDLSRVYKLAKDNKVNITWLHLLRKTTRDDAIYKIKEKIDKKEYNISYIIYAQIDPNYPPKKGNKTIILNGIKYVQFGKPNEFQTKSDYFIKNFKFNNGVGGKKNIIDKRDDKWGDTMKYITDVVKDAGRSYALAYTDAIYIYKLRENKKVTSINIKTEKKYNENVLNSIFNKYLYYDIKNNNEYDNNEYLKNNYKSKSCLLSVIIDTYHNEFNKKKSDGKRRYKNNITYEYLCNLLELELKDNTIGCTIEESLKFFHKFNLGLKVFDIYCNLIHDYTPKNINKVIKPSTLYLITTNSHVFRLKDDLKSLDSLYKNIYIKGLEVTNTYKILQDKTDDINYIVCDSVENIISNLEHISTEAEDKQIIYIQYSNCLNRLTYDFIYKYKYLPDVKIDGVMVTNINLNLKINDKKLNINISSVDKAELIDNNDIIFDELSKEKLTVYTHEYNKVYYNIYHWLVNKKHISKYNDKYKILENDTPFTPLCCVLKNTKSELIALDINKSYTSNLMNMEFVPVFTQFDTYEKFDDHIIEDYTLYYIKSNNNSIESSILFSYRYSRAYGYKLNKIDNNLYTVLYFKRPSNLYKSNSKNKINEVYENEILSSSSKKNIINIVLGLLEKKRNKKSKVKLFLNEHEAEYYIEECGGRKNDLSFFQDCENGIYMNGNTEHKNIYTVENKIEKDLINGFLPIKEMVYDIQRLKLYDMYMKCKNNNIKVYGIKTDCLLLDKDDILYVSKLFNLSNDIGGLKIEYNKNAFGDQLELIENNFIEPYEYTYNKINVNNEYDKVELGKINNNYNNIVYLADNAGSGKSTASICGYYKENVLFISPFNKQCIELKKEGYDSVTINKFFGKGICDLNISKMYDWSNKLLLVFDEILLNNIYFLNYIYDFIKENEHKIKIICNGDINQLRPINFGINNIKDECKYRLKCIQMMFNNYINLTEIKRLHKESDKIIMKNIKNDIFKGVGIYTICKKYNIKTIHKYDDVTTERNISFFNYRSNMINKLIHHKVSKTIDKIKFRIDDINIWKGLFIQCKKYYKSKDIVTYVNNLYKIVDYDDKYIFIVDLNDECNKFRIDNNKLWKIFSLSYCNTCHSEQGCSINNNLTIFDCNTPYINKYWLYTAITRCRDLDKIRIFIHDEKEVRGLEMCKFKQYINNKIEGYREQDKLSNRKITKNYVTWDWFINEFNKNSCCFHCQKSFELELKEDTVYSDITLDRIDNDICHSSDNLLLSCINCNCRKIKY